MEEFDRLVTFQRTWMLYLLAIFIIGASVTSYERIFISLLFGYVVGYYSLRFLQSRIRAYGQTVIEKGSGANLGTFIRLGGVAVVVMISLRFPEKIHLISVVIGLALSYLILFINFTRLIMATERKGDN